MKKSIVILFVAALLCGLTNVAMADDGADTDLEQQDVVVVKSGVGNKALAMMGACLGAGVVVIGGGLGISRISAHALESIARQPEAAGQMFLVWLIPAAMIEGATLFAVVICFMVVVS